jgi:hypothetical protein
MVSPAALGRQICYQIDLRPTHMRGDTCMVFNCMFVLAGVHGVGQSDADPTYTHARDVTPYTQTTTPAR